ncbi:MSHA biogenesis protein MshN [Vibrio sp. HA2012]|uniref:tetratricopeptide repeat protein n=1 Tax=Vibrio sp. HA2012 TaxID=1971595 RepID=UPI000C2B890C|nr:MSHA biogenesis protein MshN [Vibrio sp. HA2012]PJC85564.1 MSHA biogenesis protein MshN [Vibrio sp. HA2012]
MSVINNALSELANKNKTEASPLTRAEIPPVRRSGKLAWALGGGALSLCLGGWAVSQQAELVASSVPVTQITQPVQAESPTQKVAEQADITIYAEKTKAYAEEDTAPATVKPRRTVSEPVTLARAAAAESGLNGSQTDAQIRTETQVQTEAQLQAAEPVQTETAVSSGEMAIRQVKLTPEQLAQNAIQRAEKALDANKLNDAMDAYKSALRYQPDNDTVRQKLAALYYGKKDARNAVSLLQQGIKRNKDSQTLRLALSRLLLKEKQTEAALTPLVYLPQQPEADYLAMRAALAEQNKKGELALESYQLLVQMEEENARWWLGLAIQQERRLMYAEAKHAYENALSRVGVSNKTQTFIRDRLSLLEQLGEPPHAD